jgi:hypothetical protein
MPRVFLEYKSQSKHCEVPRGISNSIQSAVIFSRRIADLYLDIEVLKDCSGLMQESAGWQNTWGAGAFKNINY